MPCGPNGAFTTLLRCINLGELVDFGMTWPVGCGPVTIGQRQRSAAASATMLSIAEQIRRADEMRRGCL